MAGFTRTNGDLLPVAVYDASTGNAYTNSGNVNAVSTGNTVQPQGPQLQFFTAAGNAATLVTYTANVFAAVQQLSTVMIFEANTSPTDNTIAFALYPAAGYTTATLDTAITAALDASGAANNAVTVTGTATFTN
jgi:hypothetical protein